jgi:hypothetical protein
VFQACSWRGDEDQFYWDYFHGHFRIVGEGLSDSAALEALEQELRKHKKFVIMMTERQYHDLIANHPDFKSHIDLKFHRSNQHIFVVRLHV